MKKIPFVGGSYIYDSLHFDAQRCVNWYPARSESGTSRDEYILMPTPGLNTTYNMPDVGIRGMREVNGRAFVVMGANLYELKAGGYVLRGAITTSSSGSVSLSDNGFQLCIVDGTPTGGYIFEFSTNTFTQITDSYFLGAVNVVFIGGYFVFNKPDSGVYYISSLYDGLTGDATEFAVAEGSPDNLVAMYALQNQLYLFGTNTVEINVVDTSQNFPLSLTSGAFSEFGCSAPFAITSIMNKMFFIGRDKNGANVIYQFDAYNPSRVSTVPIERKIANYDTSLATAYSYQEEGKSFVCFNIPTMDTTLVYDVDLGLWHERAYFNAASGSYQRHPAECHVYVFGKHLVGDYVSNVIYEQSLSFNDFDGTRIRRMRTLPYIIGSLNYIYFKKFQIDMETGVGLEGGATEDTNPQIYLDWSNDNARTFSGGRTMNIGKIGEYAIRVISRMLGRARARVFRITTSTRARCYLMACYIEAEEGGS